VRYHPLLRKAMENSLKTLFTGMSKEAFLRTIIEKWTCHSGIFPI
jgi:hypothetical protein